MLPKLQDVQWDSEEALGSAVRALVAGNPVWSRGALLLQLPGAVVLLCDGAVRKHWRGEVRHHTDLHQMCCNQIKSVAAT